MATRLSVSEEPAAACAAFLETALRTALATRGQASWAVCGGSTPAPVYRRLASSSLDWTKVRVFFGDERCVPPDHEDSTYRLLQETLLAEIGSKGPTVLRMRGEEPDFELAARDYAAELPDALDLAFLGMGPDAHTASLFPGDPVNLEDKQLVRHVIGPKPPPNRLTLTPPALRGARERVVLCTGAAKAPAVQAALEGPIDPRATPSQVARDGVWFLDPPAAARLAAQYDTP